MWLSFIVLVALNHREGGLFAPKFAVLMKNMFVSIK